MLFLEVPPFDMLLSQAEPYKGFGGVLSSSVQMQTQFAKAAIEARERIATVFGIAIRGCLDTPRIIEELVQNMWNDGWNPEDSDINLFVTDLGAVLADAIWRCSGGSLIFRSATDLSHMSLWWPDQAIEVFPFHKMYKRLLTNEGESLEYFAGRIKELTRNENGTPTDVNVRGC